MFVGFDVSGFELPAVDQFDQHLIGAFHYMVVGEDNSLGVDNYARTHAHARRNEAVKLKTGGESFAVKKIFKGSSLEGIFSPCVVG